MDDFVLPCAICVACLMSWCFIGYTISNFFLLKDRQKDRQTCCTFCTVTSYFVHCFSPGLVSLTLLTLNVLANNNIVTSSHCSVLYFTLRINSV